jgi:hypothetical protein
MVKSLDHPPFASRTIKPVLMRTSTPSVFVHLLPRTLLAVLEIDRRTLALYILPAAFTQPLVPQITFFRMSAIKFPCTEKGCGKSFLTRPELCRHIWSHIPTKFRPLCPGSKKGTDGMDIPCIYRYVNLSERPAANRLIALS